MGGAMARPLTRPASSSVFSIRARAPRCARRALRPTACFTERRFAPASKTSRSLRIFQQAVDDLLIEGDRVIGCVTQIGLKFSARAVVLTTGTFLAGRIHVGLENYQAGRAGDPPAVTLAQRLRELKLPVGRLKTGTPPRIDGRSIDFSVMTEQPGDTPVPVFSFLGRREQHPPATAVLDHAHQCAHPRHHSRRARPLADVYRRDRGRGPALLPVDRRQDHALRATRRRTRSSSSRRA